MVTIAKVGGPGAEQVPLSTSETTYDLVFGGETFNKYGLVVIPVTVHWV